MECCNCISVDAPLNFIVFSASRKSLHEVTSYNQICWFSSLCCRLPFLQLEFKQECADDVVQKSHHATIAVTQGSTERVPLFSQEWFTLQRKTIPASLSVTSFGFLPVFP